MTWDLYKDQEYRVVGFTHSYTRDFTRNKLGDNGVQVNECVLRGKEKGIRVWTDKLGNNYVDFLLNPDPRRHNQLPQSDLWHWFHKPKIDTVAERYPKKIADNMAILETLEEMGGFKYYEGQRDYLARIACKSNALVVAEPGCGKTNFALSLVGLKGAKRALIVAPQGTVRGEPTEEGSMSASQWAGEVSKFAPTMPVYEIFNLDDYYNVLRMNRGHLPHGIYITYFQAFFYNKAVENCTKKMNDSVVIGKPTYRRDLCLSIGEERHGITCIAKPSLSTLIGNQFDMVCIDEAHLAQSNTSILTKALTKLQPKYRFAFTASPVPNDASNVFSIMGWLCVPDWHKKGRCNPAFPYAKEDLNRFRRDFMTTEIDKTDGTRKQSPVLSSAAHLVKILKSTMAFISKEQCNPDYIKPVVKDIRVPMGQQQSKLYEYYLDRDNILASRPGLKTAMQATVLRSVCADPMTSKYNARLVPQEIRVTSSFNPKVIAILEIVRDALRREEQVIIINSRTATSDMLQKLLLAAGVSCNRIDGTTKKHAVEAKQFSDGENPVMLMGIKCAAAYSWPQCKNLIISSIEWSSGIFRQALGRADRINSPTPPNLYVILYKDSIEEVMYDMVTVKDTAATVCVRGEYVAPNHMPAGVGEILAETMLHAGGITSQTEDDYEARWNSELLPDIKLAVQGKAGHAVTVTAKKTP